MIEIDIPSIDPIQHEPKIFFGLTSRQCICVLAGAAPALLIFALTYKVNRDFAVIATMLCIVPAILMGWYSPYNMKFEEYAKLVWFNTFVANPKRIYKTDMADDRKQLTAKERQELEKKSLLKEKQEQEKQKKAQLVADKKNKKAKKEVAQ